MIYIGLDDTDVVDSPGTNQLARRIARELSGSHTVEMIVRHQLLEDPRVPCTSKNGCAAIAVAPRGPLTVAELGSWLEPIVCDHAPPGSDPGLCITARVPAAVTAWGRRCQRELVTQDEAYQVAIETSIYLRGLGGTNGGVIGALAAVGLLAGADDGRVLYLGRSSDDFYGIGGCQTVDSLLARGIDEVRCAGSGHRVSEGTVDVGKRLRPNLVGGRVVLLVVATDDTSLAWSAVRNR
jgi:hypothetical protein